MRRRAVVTGTTVFGLAVLAVPGGAPQALALGAPAHHARAIGTFSVVASGLNNPRHLTIGPDGAVYVTEGGTGGTAGGCINVPPATTACLGFTGVVARVTPSGVVSPALTGLPSVAITPAPGAPPGGPPEILGPAAVTYANGTLNLVTQDYVPRSDGSSPFPGGANLGHLIQAAPGSAASSWTPLADMAKFAAQNPQTATTLGTLPTVIPESPFDSDPYAITPFNGGYAVADAAANALRFVDATGAVSTLAVFPSQAESFAPGVPPVSAQAVPTSVTVGPDGALYVGELVGIPSNPGTAMIYRVVPGQTPTVYASGLSAVTDVAFDQSGRLLALEYNVGGLLGRTPASGDLVRIEHDGSHTVIVNGLSNPTGVAVARGAIYISNNGDSLASSATPGELVKVAVPGADGYRTAALDGGVFAFGQAQFYGSAGALKLNAPVYGMADNPVGPGYWLVGSDGGIFNYGTAGFYGSAGGSQLNAPIIGIAPTPDGRGYWLVGLDGGVFAYGDAGFFGSAGALPLNAPIVGITATPDGGGYWLVAADGGVFAYGDAGYFGSAGALPLNAPVLGIASTPDGGGYWLSSTDGGVFAYGDAGFFGSAGALPLNAPVTSIASTPGGDGYWLVGTDGGIFAYGGAGFFGSTGGLTLNAPVVGIGA